jgi:formylglycine-generating enzyme required for sulfatase activity
MSDMPRAASSQSPIEERSRAESPAPASMEMQFAWVPGGKLARAGGSVTIHHGFYMGVHAVTQAQFKAVMGYNPAHFHFADESRPVEMVNWFDAQEFCAKLSELTAKPIRLPIEDEWEHACRAGNMPYHTGPNREALRTAGWFNGNSEGVTHPVGQARPNAFGLYDMHGNVWEWCNDTFVSTDLSSSPLPAIADVRFDGYDGSEEKDEAFGPVPKDARAVRGGCFASSAEQCVASFRHGCAPALRYRALGFRVCFDEADGNNGASSVVAP